MNGLDEQANLGCFEDAFVAEWKSKDEEAMHQTIPASLLEAMDDGKNLSANVTDSTQQSSQRNPSFEQKKGDHVTITRAKVSGQKRGDSSRVYDNLRDGVNSLGQTCSVANSGYSEKSPDFAGMTDEGIDDNLQVTDVKNVSVNDKKISIDRTIICEGRELPTIMKTSDVAESESITQWRKDRADLIAKRDSEEIEKKRELLELGKSQFEIWQSNYNEVMKATKAKNSRLKESLLESGSTQREKIGFTDPSNSVTNHQQGDEKLTVWEYVAKLCDLRPSNQIIRSDVSRMRLLMLELKNEKFVGPKSLKAN